MNTLMAEYVVPKSATCFDPGLNVVMHPDWQSWRVEYIDVNNDIYMVRYWRDTEEVQ